MEGGHDFCVCACVCFAGRSRQRIRRRAECVTAWIQWQEQQDSACILISGQALSMFGLTLKLNSTLYWMTRRLRVSTEDMTDGELWTFSILLNHIIVSNLTTGALQEQLPCYNDFLKTWYISSFNPISHRVCPALKCLLLTWWFKTISVICYALLLTTLPLKSSSLETGGDAWSSRRTWSSIGGEMKDSLIS